MIGDPNRCALCGWPLAATADMGCRRGNCSMRPLPAHLYDRSRAEAEYAITFPGQPLPIQFRDQVDAVQHASAIGELVGICQWIEKTFDMGADRSQIADPACVARRDIYAGILARIAELKEGA